MGAINAPCRSILDTDQVFSTFLSGIQRTMERTREDRQKQGGESLGISRSSHTDCRRSANLAQSLQAMDHSRFLLISTQMYGSMLSRLHLAQQIGTELAETMQGMGCDLLMHSAYLDTS